MAAQVLRREGKEINRKAQLCPTLVPALFQADSEERENYEHLLGTT